ncbi:hypothetical protein V1477_019238 [Vespula maculifrons]|uniref:Uncharacterized protein n=1 Tax=Vespula maculifrons TaxID=7453 RepID=A0ABD2ARZ1_VESMC
MTPSPPYGVTAPTDSGSLLAGTLVHSGRQRSEEGRIIPKGTQWTTDRSNPYLSLHSIRESKASSSSSSSFSSFSTTTSSTFTSSTFSSPPPLLVVRGLLPVPRYSAYRPEKPPREKQNLLTAFADTFNREELHSTFTDDDDDYEDNDDDDDDNDDDVGMLSSLPPPSPAAAPPPQLPSPIPPSNQGRAKVPKVFSFGHRESERSSKVDDTTTAKRRTIATMTGTSHEYSASTSGCCGGRGGGEGRVEGDGGRRG